jgi:hypothetical protein
VPTFRGHDGLWHNFRPEQLATLEAFCGDPALVWLTITIFPTFSTMSSGDHHRDGDGSRRVWRVICVQDQLLLNRRRCLPDLLDVARAEKSLSLPAICEALGDVVDDRKGVAIRLACVIWTPLSLP